MDLRADHVLEYIRGNNPAVRKRMKKQYERGHEAIQKVKRSLEAKILENVSQQYVFKFTCNEMRMPFGLLQYALQMVSEELSMGCRQAKWILYGESHVQQHEFDKAIHFGAEWDNYDGEFYLSCEPMSTSSTIQ